MCRTVQLSAVPGAAQDGAPRLVARVLIHDRNVHPSGCHNQYRRFHKICTCAVLQSQMRYILQCPVHRGGLFGPRVIRCTALIRTL